jgi:hypothetical protein
MVGLLNQVIPTVSGTEQYRAPSSKAVYDALAGLMSTTALAANTGAGLIGYINGLTGTVNETVSAVLKRRVTPEDFGAVGDGVTDDRAAIQAAFNSGAGTIIFGPKTYLISGSISTTTNNITVRGTVGKTVILGNYANGDTFTFGDGAANPNNCNVRNMNFTSSVQRNGGAAVRFINSHNCKADNIRTDSNLYDGVLIDGGTYSFSNEINNCELNGCSNYPIGLGENGQNASDVRLRNLLIGNNGAATIGVHMRYASGVWMSNIDVIGCKRAWETNPGPGMSVQSVFAKAFLADTSTYDGIRFGTAGGIVRMINLVGCWSSTNGAHDNEAAVTIDQGSGSVSSVSFISFEATNNRAIAIDMVSGSNIRVIGGQFLSNGMVTNNTYPAIAIRGSMSGVTIIGAAFGTDAAFGINYQSAAIQIFNGADNLDIIGNDCRTNNASILNAANGKNQNIKDNLGYTPNLDYSLQYQGIAGGETITLANNGQTYMFDPVSNGLSITVNLPANNGSKITLIATKEINVTWNAGANSIGFMPGVLAVGKTEAQLVNTGTPSWYGNSFLTNAPATHSDAGALGQIAADANYLYVCTGAGGTTNWKRIALTAY